ncbi:site-specific DNA-methyltransferase [Mesorhizobium sp. XAP10]|uniref:site-specific DNA-methyltransferase n=1 Tax=unclassified Mesorhizobium TaxID=325217 RepID=UPI0023DF48F3|nr:MULTISPECIES: site-specific DNA-methyltransferase [unclassified Mesorhizobium]MDF3154070.1 site-specific DNA-methyltransferase [Mesorhizobium sp. XAP10]MDF3247161.1 site-specific DNA-methyltransferase [Mesorhizobium sp. XAP4]
MAKKQKLELIWIGKDERPKLEPRILIEDPSLSHHAAARRSESDIFDNMLIHGDNLLALKALEADFAGKVKCVFIDPPYNTGSAFTHYDDGLEHSLWLSLMRDRLEMIRTLLSDDGSLWITIDDNEAHYLKVLCDEVFGRQNFIANVVWQKIYTVKNSARFLSEMHDHVLVYAKKSEAWQRNLLPRSDDLNASYTNLDNDPRGPWTTNAVQARNYYSLGTYEITSPTGVVFRPPTGTYWRVSEANFHQLNSEGRVWWGRDGRSIPRIKRYLSEVKQGVVPATMWFHEEAGQNAQAKAEVRELGSDDDAVFLTPKPEKLIERVLHIASNPGDLILDSFAGSGTTGAVAQKMGRRWIMVELGDHAETHILPRLKKVIDGNDLGGVTEAVGWKGGGGFRYYRLAPSLLVQDKYGNWVIASDYNAAMLAEALCRHMNFTFSPSQNPDEYWNHGFSTETDFIYVTTQNLTHDACRKISEDVGPDRSLLICCKAFNANPDSFDNLTLVKIPTAILSKCEWGRDDYSLNVQNLPPAPNEAEEPPTPGGSRKKQPDLPLFNLTIDEGKV